MTELLPRRSDSDNWAPLHDFHDHEHSFGLPAVDLRAFPGGCRECRLFQRAEPTKEQLLSRAEDAFAAGQYDKAEKEYREVLRLAPDDPAALRQLGIIYFDQGQIRAGLCAAQKIRGTTAGRCGNTTQTWLELLLALGDYTQARDAAVQVLEKQPGKNRRFCCWPTLPEP